jgi:hypothetical protein
MPTGIRWTVAVMMLAAVFASGLLFAQTRLPPSDFYILSGSDVGFRVEGTDNAGRPAGRWLVRVDGRWVEAGAAPVLRRATE